jgi:carbonic anhydrase/acetyltransferase-like protein (isoleucine patch superfamily)
MAVTSTATKPGSGTLDGRPPAATPAFGPRELLKAAARLLATLLVTPLLLTYWLGVGVIGRDRALEGHSELLSLVPGLPGKYLRRAFLARVLVACHPTASIGFGALFSKTGASIRANVYIGPRCHIGLAAIEADALIAAGAHVTSGAQTHGFADLSRPVREQEGVPALVRIGAGTWVGSAAVVMADVGRDTIVAAGSVVTKPLPDEVIAAGIPARVLRSRRDPPGSCAAAANFPEPSRESSPSQRLSAAES